jgi:hypothetical protein
VFVTSRHAIYHSLFLWYQRCFISLEFVYRLSISQVRSGLLFCPFLF